MILAKVDYIFASVTGHDSPRVAHVCYIAKVIYKKCNNCAATRAIQHILLSGRKLFNCVQEVLLALPEAIKDCLLRILRKFKVSYNELVKIVPQKICTRVSTVSVKDCKKLALGPPITLLIRRFLNIKNDGYTVFIVSPDYSLISVRSISLYHTVFLCGALSSLKIGQLHV